jgi:rhodanese-related sulfurtransferase
VREVTEVEENGHIPGTVLIPLRELADNLAYLPSFDTPIVVYCGSGWRCTIAMPALEALGWENVMSLKGGSFGGWVEAGYEVVEGLPPEAVALNAGEPDPAMVEIMDAMFSAIPEGFGGVAVADLATELVESPEIVLIDVRTPEEIVENGIIEDEQLLQIPMEELIARQAEWPQDTTAPIVVYCGSGHRSTIAMSILWTYGYENVRSLRGGIGEWVNSGYPVAGVAAN